MSKVNSWFPEGVGSGLTPDLAPAVDSPIRPPPDPVYLANFPALSPISSSPALSSYSSTQSTSSCCCLPSSSLHISHSRLVAYSSPPFIPDLDLFSGSRSATVPTTIPAAGKPNPNFPLILKSSSTPTQPLTSSVIPPSKGLLDSPHIASNKAISITSTILPTQPLPLLLPYQLSPLLCLSSQPNPLPLSN